MYIIRSRLIFKKIFLNFKFKTSIGLYYLKKDDDCGVAARQVDDDGPDRGEPYAPSDDQQDCL